MNITSEEIANHLYDAAHERTDASSEEVFNSFCSRANIAVFTKANGKQITYDLVKKYHHSRQNLTKISSDIAIILNHDPFGELALSLDEVSGNITSDFQRHLDAQNIKTSNFYDKWDRDAEKLSKLIEQLEKDIESVSKPINKKYHSSDREIL